MTQQPLITEPKRWVRVRVYGKPEPKGSFKAINIAGRAQAIPDNAKSKTWEKAVRLAASRVCRRHEWLPFDRPCAAEMTFFLRRPKKPKFRWPATKPDWDKLVRSTGDALSGIAYEDDARVVDAIVHLRYVEDGEQEVALIEVEEVME